MQRINMFLVAASISLLILIGGLLHALKQHPPYAPQIDAKQESNTTLKGEEHAKAGEPHAAKANEQYGRENAEQREDEGTEFWPPFLGLRLKITDSLLAAFTLGLLIFTGLLWRSTDKLWTAGEKQLDHLDKSSRRQLRAYVHVDEVMIPASHLPGTISATGTEIPGPIHTFRMNIVWRNSGQTPVRHGMTGINYECRSTELPRDFGYPDDPNRIEEVAMGPGGKFFSPVVNIPASDVVGAMRGTNRLYAWGWVDYNDVFEGSKRRRTEISLEIVPDTGAYPSAQTTLRFVNQRRFGGADDDCLRQPAPFERG